VSHHAPTQERTCAYCGARIRWSDVDHIWRATAYADLGGYCAASPELEHLPEGGPAWNPMA
jgi:hypothetical protein